LYFFKRRATTALLQRRYKKGKKQGKEYSIEHYDGADLRFSALQPGSPKGVKHPVLSQTLPV